MRLFRRILHPTDFSRASASALRKALELARQQGAELRLVHVVRPPAVFLEDSFMTVTTYQRLVAEGRRHAQRRLRSLVRRARRARVRASMVLLDGAAASDAIVREARRRRADLIVLGTHGRTGPARLIMGSVAARVLATARCPVLTVR